MTLRDKLVATLAQQYDQYGFNRQDAADAILAAIREHMTSPEALRRALNAYNVEIYGYDNFPAEGNRAAILAALGGEP